MIGQTYFAQRRIETAPAEIEAAPNLPAVFLIWAESGAPYLGRTALLRRRLLRLLKERDTPSRLLNLRDVARRIEYWPSGSRLESSLLFYSLARHHFPEQYPKIAKLRMPAYLKLVLSNPFPRTQVTTRLAGGRGLYFGPFRTRAAAEQFDARMLDLFQLRRCQDNLEPRPSHPGCIYGEMGMCLRPCQEVVSRSEYASEVARVEHFLGSGGQSLLESIAAARDRSSDDLQFEEAARQHKRYEQVEQVLALRDDLATATNVLSGLAVTASSRRGAVILWFMLNGLWADPIEFSLDATGPAVSLDHRLRDAVATLPTARGGMLERQEHAALLAGWFYSSWRDGEWISLKSLDHVPYRKLVNAITRTAKERCLPKN